MNTNALYTNILKHGFIDYLHKLVEVVIQVDRRANDDKYDFITKYISKNNLMIDNITILLNEHKYWDDIVQIYDENPKDIMETLVTELCKIFDKKFIMKEVIIAEEYHIDYELRRLCTAMVISPDIKKILVPSIAYLDKSKITLIPPIIQLINLSTKLYDPIEANKWPKILETIKRLHLLLDKNTLISAGEKAKDRILHKPSQTNIKNLGKKDKELKDTTTQPLINKIIYEFISDSDYILLDVPGAPSDKSDKSDKSDSPNTIPSILSQMSIETDFRSINMFIKQSISITLTYSEQDMYLSNFGNMIKKYIIYDTTNIGKKLKRVPILYIYNNTSYELVNYTFATIDKYNFKIADSITKLAFLYIDIWEVTTLNHIYNHNYSKKYLTDIFGDIDDIMDKIDIYDEKLNYSGIYVDKGIYKKTKLISNTQKLTQYCYDLLL
jgi:hypothetical protein